MSEKSDLDLSLGHQVFQLEIQQGEQSHRLPLEGKIFIGSGEEADIRVGEANLLPRHILIQLKNDLPTLKLAAKSDALSLNKNQLNPNQDYLLKEGDQIIIADISIRVCTHVQELAAQGAKEKTMVQKISEAFTSVSSILKLKKNAETSSGLKMEGTRTKVKRALGAVKAAQQTVPKKTSKPNSARYYMPAAVSIRLLALILDLAMAYAWAVTLLPMLSLDQLWPTLSQELLKQIPLPNDFLLQEIFPGYLLFFTTKLFFILVFKKSFGQLVTGMKLAESGISERFKSVVVWFFDFLFSWSVIVNLPVVIKRRTLKEFLVRTTFNSPEKIWSYVNFVTTPIVAILLFLSPVSLTTNIVFSPISSPDFTPVKFTETPVDNAEYRFIAQSGLLSWIGSGAYFKELMEKNYLILPLLHNGKMEVHLYNHLKKTKVIYQVEAAKKNETISWIDVLEDIFLNNYTPFLTCAELPQSISIDETLIYDLNIKNCFKSIIRSALKISSAEFTNLDFWQDVLLSHGPFPTTLIATQEYFTLTLPNKLNLGELNSVRFIQLGSEEFIELKGQTQTVLLSLEVPNPKPLRFETTGALDQIYRDILVRTQNKQSETNLLNPVPTINLFAPLDEMYALVSKKIRILEGDRAQNLLQFFSWQQSNLGDSPEAKDLYKKSLEDFMTLQEGQVLSKSLQELLNKLEQPQEIPSTEGTAP